MVNRTPKPMVTRRSASDLKSKRPKRNISPKNLDDSVSGLSWREERELKKALYASLQEQRRQSRDDKPEDEEEATSLSSNKPTLFYSQSRSSLSSLADSKFVDDSSCSRDSFVVNKESARQEAKKKKIRAQRKFAGFGSSRSTSLETPSKPKLKVSPVKLFPVRPKTEDFLTYLCFRGTSVLPPHMDLMNIQKEEENDLSTSNGRAGFTRDSSPASSSSMSHQNEDSMDVPEFPVKMQTPNRKAARASASTPETARGFANLNGRSSKTSPLVGSKLSPTSRRRLTDSYTKGGKVVGRSPGKGHLADRLVLKRKAMATLTAARRISPKKQESGKKLKRSASDGELLKKKYSTKAAASGGGKKSLSINRQTDTNSKTSNTHKRKSTGNIRDLVPSPAKKKKLRTSQRVKSLLKTRSSKVVKKGSKHRAKYLESLETHPRKRLATTSSGATGSATVATKVKKTFKPHRPMTRAASHMKSALKAAKLAANKKLKLVSRALPSSKAPPTSKEYSALSKIVERKRKDSISGSDKKRKKLSIESTSSKSSIGSNSNSSTSTVSIEKPSETTSSPPVSYPGDNDAPGIVECPTYYPTDEQFRDPIVYIQSIQGEAEQYGMCKIVPPSSWKMESREIEEFRFTTHVQYIHKMFHKWSPITEQLEYMKKLHKSSGPDDFVVPQIGGVEIDLVKLYELVQKYGGMKGTVGKEKKYMKIAESMRIPKQADRVSKLYAAYCKYLLPYETLLDEETEKLAETVQQDRLRQEKDRMKSPPPCYKSIHKGKSQLLSAYNRAARNIQSLYGAETAEEIEANYWEIVTQSDDHVSVQGATLDTSIYGSMFPVRRDNVYARHGWNLHNFVESKGSILHHLGLIAGVTVPTLHIGMLYSTKCFSCNQHNLPTVQYLHQGDGLVWYAVPNHESGHLKTALKKLMPKHVRDTGFCLQQNAFMVPPSKLVDKGVSVSRCVQNAREFVVVFPSVNYSNISLGHNMAESVHYGTQDWIPDGYHAAELLGVNHDIEMFSMDAMLVFLARDQTTPDTTLALLLPCLEKVVDREITERKALCEAGLKETERLEDKLDKQAKPAQKTDALEEIVICDTSNKICYLSMVLNSHENSAFSLEQGLLHLQKKKNLKHCKLMYRYSDEELKSLLRDVKNRLRGSNSSTPIRGSNPPTPVKGANSTSSLKGSNPSSPVKGVNYTTPVRGSNPSTPVKGVNYTTPVRGSNPSTPVKGVNYTTPVRGSNPATPVKGSNSSTPPSTSSPKRKTRKSMTDTKASPASSTSSK